MPIVFKLLALILTVLASHMACLSLSDIHSSSQTFKNIPLDDYGSKNLGSALDTVRKRRQEYPFANIYGLYSLPVQASEYYKRIVPVVKKQNEEVIDVPLGYSQIESNYMEPSSNDLFSTALALKLSQIFEQNNEKEPNLDYSVFKGLNMKRKRSASKPNNNNRPNSMTDKSNDFKIIKQHVEDLIKHRTGLSKTKTKRKSTRRVLKDHFKIKENKAAVKNLTNSNKSVVSPHSYSSSKISLISHKIGDKNVRLRDAKAKKLITKRKVSTSLMIDKNSVRNETKIKITEPIMTDKKVMSELSDILSDDKKDKLETKPIEVKNNVKSIENDIQSRKEIPTKRTLPLIKKKNKRSNGNIGEDIDNNNESGNELIIPEENKVEEEKIVSIVENEWPTTKEDFDEWLRKEYYKNIAKTLATMRRKRSESTDLFTDDYGADENDDINSIEESIGENIIAIEDSGEDNEDESKNNDSKNSEKVEDESDDDYVIATQDGDVSSDKDLDESLIWSDIEAKNDNHKSKRSVSSYFGEIGDNEETNEVGIDSERFANVNNKLQVIEDALINEALDLIRDTARKDSLSEIQTNKIENRLDAAYDIEDMRLTLDNLHKAVVKMNHENSDDDRQQELDNEISLPVTAIVNQRELEKKSDIKSSLGNSKQYCFELEMLSTDCSSVADLVPNGKVKDSFTEACYWHEVCYTCGEVYGLLSSDCDAGFLEASRLACDGSPSCETFARLILSPLRQSRVFYKSNVPLTCYKYQCIRDFLTDTQDRKR